MANKKIVIKQGKPEIDTPLIKSPNLFPVVGIGASAGGLDAFKKLLKAIPEDSGMAYVLVQHLDPKHESMLPELLQKVTKIPVLEITDDIKVHPDHIYVIPSNKMMVATDGVLLLAPRPAKSDTGRNLPIDLFFTSLAEVHQEHAIGVVLSGTASDGTLGLKAIKDHGGITFAQDEASAEYEGMPHSAAAAGVVDFILSPEQIPQKLLEITNKTKLSDEDLQNIPRQDEDVFKQILSLLRIRKGVDFTYYKQTTIRRRILRRMVVNKNEEPADYLKYLRGSTAEQDLLYQDMLIPVTSFFRDKKVFENLCKNVFPTILKNKIPGDITRIWIAGCSTGQEVYSFAICFKEFLGDDHERIQIFGTDLSEPAITKARQGIYEKSEINGISPQRLQEFFTKSNGSYQVNKIIRDMCVFAHHNFLKDPPFGKMDCISCRNVLIYMEPYLQKKALTTFHYALNPKGFLLLGKSETTGVVPDLFALVEKNDKLYTRKNVTGRFMQVTSQRSEQILNSLPDNSKKDNDRSGRTDFQKTADDIILTKYTPAGVVVNEAMDIVHFRGNTANFLQQAPGKPSHNLLMMAKNGLGFELRNILHKAKTDNAPVIKDNIPLNVNGQLLHISIEALPLPNTLEPYYLVLFHDNNLNDNHGLSTGTEGISKRKKVSAHTKKDEKEIQIKLLEQELAQAREDMRSITEDQEANNEELQSANEELLSGSEELQSLNEELETSKEELQSTNEELTVLNHELISLNEQVTDARNYSESIIATLYHPLLVLDKHLRVKTANQAFYKTFKVDEQETEGILIYDLGNRQWNIPELRILLEEILPEKKQIIDYEVTHNFLSLGERIILLRGLEITKEKKEEKLILLTLEDITERKHAEQKVEESEFRYHNMIYTSPSLIAIFKGENMIIDIANDAILESWGKDKNIIGQSLFSVLPEIVEQGFKKLLLNVFKTGEPFYGYETPVTIIKDDKPELLHYTFIYQAQYNILGHIEGVAVMANEVSQQVEIKSKLVQSEQQLRKTTEHFEIATTAAEVGIWSLDIASQKLEWSGLHKKIWGYDEGRTDLQYEDWHTIILEEDKESAFAKVADALKAKTLYENSYRIKRADSGDIRWIHSTGQYFFNENGEPVTLTGISVDITIEKNAALALKESEENFRQLADLMPQKVWTADTAGNYNYFNQCWYEYTGLPFEKLKDWGWQEVIHPDDWAETKLLWEQSISTGENFEMEHRILNTEGIYKWHLSRGLLQSDVFGKRKLWIGTNTEMHQIKEEEQRKGDFLKMVSHELKTPVTSIKGYVQLLLSMIEDETKNFSSMPLKSSLTRIDSQVKRLSRLIAEILDLTRIESGKLELQQEVFRLDELMKDTVQDISFTNTRHAITVSTEINAKVYGDKDRIGQVIINLVNNAIKYSPDNNPIEVRLFAIENNEVGVSIKDKGIGIEERNFQKIFGRFFRADGTSEKNYSGFGIGLFIAKEIIQRHNGRITVESEQGHGSVFTFTLPLLT